MAIRSWLPEAVKPAGPLDLLDSRLPYCQTCAYRTPHPTTNLPGSLFPSLHRLSSSWLCCRHALPQLRPSTVLFELRGPSGVLAMSSDPSQPSQYRA